MKYFPALVLTCLFMPMAAMAQVPTLENQLDSMGMKVMGVVSTMHSTILNLNSTVQSQNATVDSMTKERDQLKATIEALNKEKEKLSRERDEAIAKSKARCPKTPQASMPPNVDH